MDSGKNLAKATVKGNLGVLVITSNDWNTLTFDTITELGRKFDDLVSNPDVGCVVFTGYPKSFFSAGADVGEIHELAKSGDREKAFEALEALQAVFVKIDDSPKPTIAAINGYCLGGGLELALACDFRIASENATTGLPEIDLGILPGLGGTQRLPRLIGAKSALKVLLGGKKMLVSAKSAKEKGIVDLVIAGDFIGGIKTFVEDVLAGRVSKQVSLESTGVEGESVAGDFETIIEGKSKTAVEALTRSVRLGLGLSLREALRLEQRIFVEQLFSPDGREGIAAFVEKRAPRFGAGEVSANIPEKAAEGNHCGCETGGSRDRAEEYEMVRSTLRDFGEKEIAPQVNCNATYTAELQAYLNASACKQ